MKNEISLFVRFSEVQRIAYFHLKTIGPLEVFLAGKSRVRFLLGQNFDFTLLSELLRRFYKFPKFYGPHSEKPIMWYIDFTENCHWIMHAEIFGEENASHSRRLIISLIQE